MTVPVIRQRAKHSKGRSGCKTCKERRVKCDERQPTCFKCENSGRRCGGYGNLPAKNVGQGIVLPKLEPAAPGPLQRLAMLPCTMHELEIHALDYFRLYGIHYLPGSDWLLNYSRIVLPLCQTEPAVALAAVALGSLQRALMIPEDRGVEHFCQALVQYNRSINAVQTSIKAIGKKRGSSSAAEMILVVTLLLFGFDVLQGADNAAALHLKSGLKILFEQVKDKAPPHHLQKDERIVGLRIQPKSRVDVLTHTFVRLDADLALIAGDDPYLYPVCNQHMPLSFSSLEDAMVYLNVLEREIFHIWSDWFQMTEQFVISTRDDYTHLHEDMRDILVIAAMNVDDLESNVHLNGRALKAEADLKHFRSALTSGAAVSEYDPARILVDVHFFFLWVVVCTWRDAGSMEVDRFEGQFAHILGRAEQYIVNQQELQLQDLPFPPLASFKSRPAAALGTSIGQLVTIIIELCRDSIIRRRGINLIRSMNMRGVYDSDYLASFYDAIVELEESWAREIDPSLQDVEYLRAHQIPSQARIVECGIINATGIKASPYQIPSQARIVECGIINATGIKASPYQIPSQARIVERGVVNESGEKAYAYDGAMGQLGFARYTRGDGNGLEVEQRTFFMSRTSTSASPSSSNNSESPRFDDIKYKI